MTKTVRKKWPGLILIAMVVVIVAIRLPALSARTVHIDEGMGIRASELILSGEWRYSPHNGHGPTLFYLGAPIRSVFGVQVGVFRAITAGALLLSLLIMFLVFRPVLNFAGRLVLLISLGLSPGLLFFSAYFIHESVFILLTAATLTSFIKWNKSRHPIWIFLAVLSAGLMYLTKETALFTYFAWAVAFGVMRVSMGKSLFRGWQATIKTWLWPGALGVLALIGIYLLTLGSSLDIFRAPFLWLVERGTSIHVRPWYYFFGLLARHEFWLLALGLAGAILLSLKKSWSPAAVFCLTWFLTVTALYSLVPYKTPWLIMNLILPLGLFTALAWSKVWPQVVLRLRPWLILALLILTAGSLYQVYQDNFAHPDRALAYDYAYLQGGEDFKNFLAILEELNRLAAPKPLTLQIIGQGDELLHVLTEKYNRHYAPFVPGLLVYINYQHEAAKLAEWLGADYKNYYRQSFRYFVPGPMIDLFIRIK